MADIKDNLKLGFIGAGTVGTALAVRLAGKGYRINSVFSRSKSSSLKLIELTGQAAAYDTAQRAVDNADFIFITTPDDVIPEIANSIRWHSGQYVVHCSGADSLDILESAGIVGANVGSFHPLQTFANVQKAIDNLPGSTFAVEGSGTLLEILKTMSNDLGGNWIKLEAGAKAAYHAAAVMVSNYTVTLVKMAGDLWESFGISREESIHALLPLLKGTLNNIDNLGIPDALTGPVARGDSGTVRMHLETLKNTAPDVLAAYSELGLQTIPVALAKGKISKNQAQEIENLLKRSIEDYSGRKTRCVQC
jgi:predicted short-subunit dehydrogenase-like oxidoreductase (DUF2520 family)